MDDWAYLLWVDEAEKVHPREKPLLLLLPDFDKSLVALDGEEAPLVEVGGGPPPWVESVQDFLRKLAMKPHMHLVEIKIVTENWVIEAPSVGTILAYLKTTV